jgi:hypothetical protein
MRRRQRHRQGKQNLLSIKQDSHPILDEEHRFNHGNHCYIYLTSMETIIHQREDRPTKKEKDMNLARVSRVCRHADET